MHSWEYMVSVGDSCGRKLPKILAIPETPSPIQLLELPLRGVIGLVDFWPDHEITTQDFNIHFRNPQNSCRKHNSVFSSLFLT